MSENAPQTLKFVRSATLPVVTNLPPISSPKSSHAIDFSLFSNDKPIIPLAALNQRESPSLNNSVSHNESQIRMKDGQYTPRTARILLNEKILAHLDRIISDRPTAYKSAKGKDKAVFRRGFTSEFDNMSKDHKVQELFEAYRKFLGIQEGAKDRAFDSKFDIFREVKTFIDARKLFQDNTDSTASQSSPKNPSEISTFVTAMKAVCSPRRSPSPNRSLQPQTPGRTQIKGFTVTDSFFNQMGVTPRGAKKRISIKPVGLGGLAKKDGSILVKKRDLSVSDKKDLEIRQMYRQLKENAIEKFGIGIFEKAQKRLKDPEQVKHIEQKRQDEITKMRKMKDELVNFEIGAGLIHTLSQQNKEVQFQEEVQDKFQNYMGQELSEDDSDEDKIPQISDLYPNEGLKQRIKELGLSLSKQKPKVTYQEDPQVKLLQQAKYLQEKGDKVFKVFRTKIAKANKGLEVLKSVNKPSRVQCASPISHGDLPSPIQGNGTSSLILHHRDEGKWTMTPTSVQTPFMKTGLKLAKGKSQTDLEFPNMWNDEVFGKVPVDVNKIEGDLNKLGNGKKTASLQFQKNLLFDICHSLANLSTTNREMKKELQASIKEMDSSYAKKARTLKNLEIPESLMKPVPKSFGKNAIRVSASLAEKVCRARKFE